MEAISKFELESIVARSKTLEEVVIRSGLSRSKLLRLMKIYKMPTKLTYPGSQTSITKTELYALYVLEERSLRNIADLYGVSHQAVANWLKVHGIEARKQGKTSN
jgi:hypothetical protein